MTRRAEWHRVRSMELHKQEVQRRRRELAVVEEVAADTVEHLEAGFRDSVPEPSEEERRVEVAFWRALGRACLENAERRGLQ